MKKFLISLLILLFCLALMACNDSTEGNNSSVSNNGNSDASSKIDETNISTDLSNGNIEGVDSKTDENIDLDDNKESATLQGCQCECCTKNSSMAILIAQTHFFGTVDYNKKPDQYYTFEVLNEDNIYFETFEMFFEAIDDNYWYIMSSIWYKNESEHFPDGPLYVYKIKKSTGEIADLLIIPQE